MNGPTGESGGDQLTLLRRRLLQGFAAAGTAAAAGCQRSDTDDDASENESEPAESEEDEPEEEPAEPEPPEGEQDSEEPTEEEPEEVEEDTEPGGRLEFAFDRSDLTSYDIVDASDRDRIVLNPVYGGGLVRRDETGERYLWAAETYDADDANDVSMAEDYTAYMQSYEITDRAEDTPEFDLDWPNVVLGIHPDDEAAFRSDDLAVGDEMRILTRTEAAKAVEDGTYGVRVTGKLREGIEFHNGEELTAGNVVDSHDRYAGSASEGVHFDTFLHARAPDGEEGYTFELYAQEPDATATDALEPVLFSSAQVDVEPPGLDPRESGAGPIGIGPYELDSVEDGSGPLLVRTDSYWVESYGLANFEWSDGVKTDLEAFPATPPIEEINVRFVPYNNKRTLYLKDGTVDIAYDLQPEDKTTFHYGSGTFREYTVVGAYSTEFLFMQAPTVDGGALADPAVREAISALIPRQDIVKFVEEEWAMPAKVPFPKPAATLATTQDYEDIEDEDWAYSVEPEPERAERVLADADVETPIPVELNTNADNVARQDKLALIVDELNNSKLFDAEMETPAAMTDWFAQELTAADSEHDYAERNATASLGLGGGFDPHAYIAELHHPANYNACCNFFFEEGTFDWIPDLEDARFGVDVATDDQLRRERYDDLWPRIVADAANIFIDFSVETAVAAPPVEGFEAYALKEGFLSWSLHAPFSGQVTRLDRE